MLKGNNNNQNWFINGRRAWWYHNEGEKVVPLQTFTFVVHHASSKAEQKRRSVPVRNYCKNKIKYFDLNCDTI